MAKYGKDDFTHIDEPDIDLDIWVCDNCGASADKIENIQHCASCKPGEAKYWEEFYSKEENQT